ncbi:MAG: hypothetical protein AB1390_11905 [Nitrospirota bacterium]
MLKRDNLPIFLIVIFLAFYLFAGCAKPPTQEIKIAEKNLADAKQKEADLYSPDLYVQAESKLEEANHLVAAKKYKEAKAATQEASVLAQQAISMVEPNKQKMKEETETMIQDAQVLMDEVKSLATQAIKKKAVTDKEEILGLIGKFDVDMVSAKEQLEAQKIRQANDQIITLTEELKSQKEKLTAMLEQKESAKNRLSAKQNLIKFAYFS